MSLVVKQYWQPFFSSVLLGELAPHDLDRFLEHLASFTISNVRKNNVLKAGTIPLRWAYRKEKISQDITRSIVAFSARQGNGGYSPL